MRLSGFIGFVSLCLCFGTASSEDFSSTPFPGVPDGDAQMIQFGQDLGTGSKPTVSVISNDESGLLIEFSLPEIGVLALDVDGQTFHAMEIEGGAYRGQVGDPMLPTYSRLIQVPDGVGVAYDVESVETTELTGYRPVPMQEGDNASFAINPDTYSRLGYDDTARSEISSPAIARDLRVVPITFNPVRFNPAAGKVEVATTIRVQVNFTGVDLRNEAPLHHSIIPESFHQMYKKLVVNYAGPRTDQTVGLGKYVIICPNNSTVISKLQPLIEWRTRKGYEVRLATTSETGTSRNNIQTWLRNAYTGWDNPPEHIVLIGDSGGSISIPYWTEGWSGYSGEGDHPYVQLDGDDVLADAHIGRISVGSTSDLELYVNKIVGYESTPYMTDTSWYKRGCVVGDPSSSGYTTVQSMQWLKSKMLDHDYSEVDTVFTGPFSSNMRSKISRGGTVCGYRGYYRMSSFYSEDIEELTNGRKMPFAVILTCDTGSFAHGFARSEAFMRAGEAPNTPTAGIASIGTATTGTNTRFNNCVTYGIWGSFFSDHNYHFGTSLTRGKYELYVNYWSHDQNGVKIFSHWNNLMGDPGGEIWTDIPQAISVSHPSSIALGANSVTVSVTKDAQPCANAYVCLWKGEETHTGAYTNEAGEAEIPVDTPTSGTMKITVTKHDHHPYLSSISVGQQSRFVGYLDHNLDGDGNANPGETLELDVQLKNFGTSTANSVTGTLSCDDPYVTIIDSNESFGTITPNNTAWCADNFNLELAGGIPSGHIIQLSLVVHSDADNWNSIIEIPVAAAAFSYRDLDLYNVGTQLDPGDSGQLSLELNNIGDATGSGITGTLFSASEWVTITGANRSFGNIGAGSYGSNSGDPFGISASSECYQGHQAQMQLRLEFSNGAIDTVNFSIPVGNASSDDPTGPDAYGYYAFDNTDTSYDEAPTYSWVEIAPNLGGPGTSVGLGDFDDRVDAYAEDDSKTITLPFDFTYYGETFTRATICSNGWMAMGSTSLTNYRNWNIPCQGAPPNLIAPMWDNLFQSGNDKVYSWYDSAQHRYIVQWNRLKNVYPSYSQPISNFQVILYDPDHYETETGDGIIVFQYATFNNSDSRQMYSTTGIQNATNTTGVMYGYFNSYNTGAANITSGRAIKFIARAMEAIGFLGGEVTNASDNNKPLPNATIQLIETGQTFSTNAEGLYSGDVMAGTYTIAASHPSFESDTLYNVNISANDSVIRDFALTDIVPPLIRETTEHANTTDTDGPYDISTIVADFSSLDELTLYYFNGNGWTARPMTPEFGGGHEAQIPGALYTTQVQYYVFARDAAGLESTDPPAGESEPYSFWVMPPAIDDDVEEGIGDWTHQFGSIGYSDQWHRTDARNHTGGGDYSWKFGGTGTSDYDGFADGCLTSPLFELEDHATLTFWHRMNAEINPSDPDRAFDGGYLEISINGSAWFPISPDGGYTHTIDVGDGTGPFPDEAPVYSGDFDWTSAKFRLEVVGSIQIRFRFGSNQSNSAEGWYLDDIYIMPDSPGLSETPDQAITTTQLMLYQNQPNPFSSMTGETRIRFNLPSSADVALRVFDTSGRLVRNLVNERMPTGQHEVSWDGRDQNARRVGSGVYFYTLTTDDARQAKQMLILK